MTICRPLVLPVCFPGMREWRKLLLAQNNRSEGEGWWGRQCKFRDKWDVRCPTPPSGLAQNGCQPRHTWSPTWRRGPWDTMAAESSSTKTHVVMAHCFGSHRSWEHAGFQTVNNNCCLYLLWSVPALCHTTVMAEHLCTASIKVSNPFQAPVLQACSSLAPYHNQAIDESKSLKHPFFQV